MKKYLIILAAILTAVVWYIYDDPDLSHEVKKEVKQFIPSQNNTTTVYKWRDAKGNWQITDQPPATGTPYETLHYQSNTNIMPAEVITGRPAE